MDVLRQEIIETQKARSELIKWKLIIVSVLGAAGLGFTAYTDWSDKGNAEALLCCIPVVCAYVDAQYWSLSLRIQGIATFFRTVGPKVNVAPGLAEYEEFMALARRNWRKHFPTSARHGFQSWAVRMSSSVFSLSVAVYAVASFWFHEPRWWTFAMLISGIAGIGFDWWLGSHTRDLATILMETGKERADSFNKNANSK
jgi:hypothetical protein